MRRVNSKSSECGKASFMRATKRFTQSEDGFVVELGLVLFILMLILGGMAVDFMRFELHRIRLQAVTDSSVLGAANLSNQLQPDEVVIDYFEKAGLDEYINGTPQFTSSATSRTVRVTATEPVGTYFLKLLNIRNLDAQASGTARQGLGNIEVSLVLDVSGSMRDNSASGKTKIREVRDAAKLFVQSLLLPENANKVSISLIPYSEQVNAGPDIMGEMNVPAIHNWSHCIEFANAEYSSVVMNPSLLREQSQHYMYNPSYDSNNDGIDDTNVLQNKVTNTVCPQYAAERISPLSQNPGALVTQINGLQPRAGTSIFLGVKWAAALLDPSMRPVVSSLIGKGKVDPAFAGRPVDHITTGSNDTLKFIVLMTDGKNDNSNRLINSIYDTESERAHWATTNWWWHVENVLGWRNYSNLLTQRYNAAQGDILLDNVCTAAKQQGIAIYTIAFEAPPEGQAALNKCATSASYAFNVSGSEIVGIFKEIADQISSLRLTQ